jgi:hypothetical protein
MKKFPAGLAAGWKNRCENGLSDPGKHVSQTDDMFLITALPNAEQDTSVAPDICRARSYVTVPERMAAWRLFRITSAAGFHPM